MAGKQKMLRPFSRFLPLRFLTPSGAFTPGIASGFLFQELLMKRLLLACLLCLTPLAQAAPFLVCDPTNDGTITTFVYQEGTVVTKSPVVLAACHADLAAVPAGTHTYTVWFEDALGAKSVSVPFTFIRSIGGGPGPAGLRLSPN